MLRVLFDFVVDMPTRSKAQATRVCLSTRGWATRLRGVCGSLMRSNGGRKLGSRVPCPFGSARRGG